MNERGIRRAVVTFALVVLLVGGASVALVSTAPARAAMEVHVNASDNISVTAETGYMFTPNTFVMVPTNSTITVTFTDNDNQDHTFTILGIQGVNLPTDTSSARIDQLAFGDSPTRLFNANASASGGSGDQVTASFHSPGAGWYEFVCTESGHFQNGMYGFMAFGENLPGNLTVVSPNTNPGVAVFIIVGTIVGLVVIALVLGFVVGRRRGSTYEMPPQRLGYAEPTPPESTDTPPLSEEPKG